MKSWLGLFFFLWTTQAAHAETKIGQLAPIFVMTTLDGQDFNLSLLRGKVVLINYWATWCPPCIREQKLLNNIYKRYHARGLEMIGVSQDDSTDRSKVLNLKSSIPYPVAMADEARINDFGDSDTIPTSFLIDRNGLLRRIFTNDKTELSEAKLRKAVQALLTEHQQPAK